MKNIAVIAYAVSDKYGSEYAVGWNYVKEMSLRGEYHLTVYYGSNKPGSMGKTEPLPQLPNVSWKCIELPKNALNKLYWFLRRNIYYVFGFYFQFKEWHKIVTNQIKKDSEENRFDLIHYLNPIGFKEPGTSYNINLPYLWGPVQGVEVWPECLYPILDKKGRIEAELRKHLQLNKLRNSQRVKKAILRTDYLIGATPNSCRQFKDIFNKDSLYLPENGLLQIEANSPISYSNESKLELVWIGELSNRKALILLLKALSSLDGNYKDKIHLNVLGTGILKEKLETYTNKNNINNIVTFYGGVSRKEVQDILKKCHLHVITSMSEATTTVIWEAKAKGIPTMTLDHCGMAGVINEKCGIKIPIKNLNQVLNDMAFHIKKIIDSPNIIHDLSIGVLEDSKKYLWDKRYALFTKAYNEAIDNFNRRTK